MNENGKLPLNDIAADEICVSHHCKRKEKTLPKIKFQLFINYLE